MSLSLKTPWIFVAAVDRSTYFKSARNFRKLNRADCLDLIREIRDQVYAVVNTAASIF
jgi:hypothetical protein